MKRCHCLLSALALACGNDGSGPRSPAGTGGGGAAESGGATTSGGAVSSGGSKPTTVGGSSSAASGGTPGGGGVALAGGTSGRAGAASGAELLRATFDAATPGPYREDHVQADFGATPRWNDGLDEGRASVVYEAGQRFLRVTYPANLYGPGAAGVQFAIPLAESHEELFFAYRVRFGAGFSFVKGGKLPGLAGGSSPTGCKPSPDGFSARNMWRGGGAIVQYVYWPEQPNTCGDDLRYERGGDATTFTPGQWHTIEHRVRMNAVGSPNGVFEAWVDSERRLSDEARLWRNDGTFAIDTLYFSTFFGGGDGTWAPSTAQTVDFDDLVISTEPITH